MPDLTQPAIIEVALYEFTWGSNVARYARCVKDIVFDGNTFTALPTISWSAEMEDGSVDSPPREVIMPLSVAPATTLGERYIHAEVQCKIWSAEIDGTATIQGAPRPLWLGFVGKRVRSRESLRLEILGLKDLLRDVPIGLPSLAVCVNVFGDSRCQIDLAANGFIHTFNVLSIDANDGRRLNVSVPGSVYTNWVAQQWNNGTVDLDDAKATIWSSRQGAVNVLSFVVNGLVPPSWVGQDITVTQGCNGYTKPCFEVYNNLENRNAIGEFITLRHPSLGSTNV